MNSEKVEQTARWTIFTLFLAIILYLWLGACQSGFKEEEKRPADTFGAQELELSDDARELVKGSSPAGSPQPWTEFVGPSPKGSRPPARRPSRARSPTTAPRLMHPTAR